MQQQPGQQLVQRADPYGLPAVERPHVPFQGGSSTAVGGVQYGNQGYGTQGYGTQTYGNQVQGYRADQTIGVGYVITGAICLGLSFVGLIPGSPIYFLSYGAIFAIIGGARVLSRRSKGYAIKAWPGIVALVLGILAVLISGSEFALNSLVASHVSSTGSLSAGQGTTGGDQASGGAQGGSSSGVIPAPPTWAADPNLTAYEKTAAAVALSVDQYANGGMAYSPNPSWPSSLTLDQNGQVMLPSGTSGATLPVGDYFKYEVSDDKKNFAVFISGGDKSEIAIYDSESNSFKWICEAGASSTCPAGGLSADGAGSGSSTSNS